MNWAVLIPGLISQNTRVNNQFKNLCENEVLKQFVFWLDRNVWVLYNPTCIINTPPSTGIFPEIPATPRSGIKSRKNSKYYLIFELCFHFDRNIPLNFDLQYATKTVWAQNPT